MVTPLPVVVRHPVVLNKNDKKRCLLYTSDAADA